MAIRIIILLYRVDIPSDTTSRFDVTRNRPLVGRVKASFKSGLLARQLTVRKIHTVVGDDLRGDIDSSSMCFLFHGITLTRFPFFVDSPPSVLCSATGQVEPRRALFPSLFHFHEFILPFISFHFPPWFLYSFFFFFFFFISNFTSSAISPTFTVPRCFTVSSITSFNFFHAESKPTKIGISSISVVFDDTRDLSVEFFFY